MIMIMPLLPGNAYFIHPEGGEVIHVPHSHIALVINRPDKFQLNSDYVRATYIKYGEKIGVEGRARREIILHLLDLGFIRIRKYRNYWKVNVKDLFMYHAAEYLSRWAIEIEMATNDIHMEVVIDQNNGKAIKTDLKTLASYQCAGNPKS